MTEPLEPTDDALMAGLAAQDLGALASLYDRYGRLGYALAYRILGEAEAAEDALHDAFLLAWRGADWYRRECGTARGGPLPIVHPGPGDAPRRKTAFPPAPLA